MNGLPKKEGGSEEEAALIVSISVMLGETNFVSNSHTND